MLRMRDSFLLSLANLRRFMPSVQRFRLRFTYPSGLRGSTMLAPAHTVSAALPARGSTAKVSVALPEQDSTVALPEQDSTVALPERDSRSCAGHCPWLAGPEIQGPIRPPPALQPIVPTW
jgi:hypothetical protein